MGGYIGFGLAKYLPERCASLIIGGQAPYARSFEVRRQQLRRGIEQGIEALVASLETQYGAMWPGYIARLRTTDLVAQLALAQDRPSLEDILPTMIMPCLLYAGDADANYAGVTACCKQIPNVTFISMPGLNHLEGLRQLHVVLPHITQFLATVPLERAGGKEMQDGDRGRDAS